MYELDGLKPFPVDHGPLNSDHVVGTQNAKSSPNWTNKFKNIIRQRLSSFNSGQQNHEIRFNLMALVPDKMPQLTDQIDLMKHNYTTIYNLLIDFKNACLTENDFNNIHNLKSDLTQVKSEPSILIKKENEPSEQPNLTSSPNESKPNTRQLRSSRSSTQNSLSNQKEPDLLANKLNEQFEMNFYLESSEECKVSLIEMCKLYRIEAIKTCLLHNRQAKIDFDLLSDVKEKENELISKIKLQLNSVQVNKYEDGVLVKKVTDLAGLKLIEAKLGSDLELEEGKLSEELEKRKKYKTDALRRKHIYEEFIVTYLKILNETGKLTELVQNNLINQQSSSSSKRRKK